jgi:aminopeptidase N
LDQYEGQLDVTGASLNGITASYQYTSEHTAVQILPAQPLPIGTRAQVRLGYTGQAPLNDDGTYTLFGQSDGILALPFFYPMMPARRGDKWSLDVADPQGDYGFEESALYQVDVTAPADEIIAATGAATRQTPRPDGQVTTHYVVGPAREFAMALSPRYQVLNGEAYGAQIHSYFLPEDADSGKAALIDAIAAIQIYSNEFGPYPFRNMSAVEAPIGTQGQEFPGMSFLGSDDYRSHQDSLEVLIAHESAHQWWYNQVGNDRTQMPWLGDALAESSVYVYFADRHGVPAAELLRQQRWEAPVSYAASAGHDAPIGLPVADYKQDNYEAIVYAKGALFMLALRDEVGAFQYRRGLQAYLDSCRWRIATPDDLRHAMESVSRKDLRSLFDKWVGGAVG